MKQVEVRTAVATRSLMPVTAVMLGLAVAASSFAGALAQTAPSPPPAQPQTTPGATGQAQASDPKPKHDPEQDIICRTEDGTGSRLDRQRICHSRAEWRQMAHDSADVLNNYHKNAGPQ